MIGDWQFSQFAINLPETKEGEGEAVSNRISGKGTQARVKSTNNEWIFQRLIDAIFSQLELIYTRSQGVIHVCRIKSMNWQHGGLAAPIVATIKQTHTHTHTHWGNIKISISISLRTQRQLRQRCVKQLCSQLICVQRRQSSTAQENKARHWEKHRLKIMKAKRGLYLIKLYFYLFIFY